MSTDPQLTRRQAVKAAGALGAAYIAAPVVAPVLAGTIGETAIAATTCARLTPELTEGPYWVNTMLHRSDVRGNSHGGGIQAGVPLSLYINVIDTTTGCHPLNSVAVDIWHANAHGVYSDEPSQSAGGGTPVSDGDTSADNFLRGYQLTGRDKGLRRRPHPGQVSFATIWPGWYLGRAIHIHVRVRRLATSGATIAGYTTQIFFSDTANDHVLTGAAPYNTRSPQKDPTTDETDSVLQAVDDATNIVSVIGSVAKGYTATFNIALDTTEVDAAGSLGRPAGGTGAPGGAGGPLIPYGLPTSS